MVNDVYAMTDIANVDTFAYEIPYEIWHVGFSS